MNKKNAISDHDLWILLKDQDAQAWELVWQNAVLAEARCLRNSELARKWGVSPEELMGLLYEEMISKGRINLYRDEGGSIYGWLRRYVRGYILKADPARGRTVPIEGLQQGDDDDGTSWEEKLAKKLSDERGRESSPFEDPAMRRREEWAEVQRCFGLLWRDSPIKAYVHLLKLRLNLSSRQIKDMLGISSEANVDQLFSRAVKDMRELRDGHGQDA